MRLSHGRGRRDRPCYTAHACLPGGCHRTDGGIQMLYISPDGTLAEPYRASRVGFALVPQPDVPSEVSEVLEAFLDEPPPMFSAVGSSLPLHPGMWPFSDLPLRPDVLPPASLRDALNATGGQRESLQGSSVGSQLEAWGVSLRPGEVFSHGQAASAASVPRQDLTSLRSLRRCTRGHVM